MILGSRLPERVKERAIAVFTRLGEAEAAIHGVPVEKIHFHEVGALDAIADIVGAVAGLERLGVGAVFFSTLRLGGGTVQAQHGTLPVPAPATARLVTGLQCELGPVPARTAHPDRRGHPDHARPAAGRRRPLRIEQIGYGAGGRDDPGPPERPAADARQAAPAAAGRSGRGLGAGSQPRRHDRRGHRPRHRAAPRRRRAGRLGDADPDEEIAPGVDALRNR